MISALFLVISTLGLLAALGTVLSRNLVHAGLHLVAFFFVVACQFVLLEAEFMAAIQVLIYIGAVAILLMFAIMLTRNILGDDSARVSSTWRVPAYLAALGVFLVLAVGIQRQQGTSGRPSWSSVERRPVAPADSPRGAAINNMGKAVGDEMLTRYVIPFEVAGLLLTAGLVGAVALAYREGDTLTPRLGPIDTLGVDTTGERDSIGADRGVSKAEALSSLSEVSASR